jgi:hypothetical protein
MAIFENMKPPSLAALCGRPSSVKARMFTDACPCAIASAAAGSRFVPEFPVVVLTQLRLVWLVLGIALHLGIATSWASFVFRWR